jgi:3'(2'), 5'-bisphosphate nucleotidase
VFELPEAWLQSRWGPRLRVGVDAVMSAGAALNAARSSKIAAREVDSQLKTAIDLAAEGWVLGWIAGSFPQDRILAEEQYAQSGSWTPSEAPFWTIDALDGTRSFVEGFAGFGVQVAFVDAGRPVLGVVMEPAAGRCYAAVEGLGAYQFDAGGRARRIELRQCPVWPQRPRFVDSLPPAGVVGRIFDERRGRFVECGSIGLKACRVATDEADVYAKAFRFRIWDVAPVEPILTEAGCSLRLWSGGRVDYSGRTIEFSDLVAAPEPLLESLLERLERG